MRPQPVEKAPRRFDLANDDGGKDSQMATLYGYQRVLKDLLPMKGWSSAFWKDGVANIDENSRLSYTSRTNNCPAWNSSGRRPSTSGP